MPLVKIDLIKGVRNPQEIKKLADVVQKVMLEHFNAPPRDRYQVLSTRPKAAKTEPPLYKSTKLGLTGYNPTRRL